MKRKLLSLKEEWIALTGGSSGVAKNRDIFKNPTQKEIREVVEDSYVQSFRFTAYIPSETIFVFSSDFVHGHADRFIADEHRPIGFALEYLGVAESSGGSHNAIFSDQLEDAFRWGHEYGLDVCKAIMEGKYDWLQSKYRIDLGYIKSNM